MGLPGPRRFGANVVTPGEAAKAVEVVRAALCEVGVTADLWSGEEEGGVLVPIVGWYDFRSNNNEHVARALMLGHRAVGHDALAYFCEVDRAWFLQCRDCWPDLCVVDDAADDLMFEVRWARQAIAED